MGSYSSREVYNPFWSDHGLSGTNSRRSWIPLDKRHSRLLGNCSPRRQTPVAENLTSRAVLRNRGKFFFTMFNLVDERWQNLLGEVATRSNSRPLLSKLESENHMKKVWQATSVAAAAKRKEA